MVEEDQPVRVLHLVKTSSGATWAFRQMRELVKLGVEVHVALPSSGGLEQKYRDAGITVHIAPVESSPRHPLRSRSARQNLIHLARHIQPDLVHSHFVSTTITMRLALRHSRLPLLFQVPGPLHLEHAFFRRAELALASHNDFWIASCNWTREAYLRQGVSEDRVFLSYYGTDLPQELPAGGTLRGEIDLAPSDQVVGMVAFMYAPKRYLGQSRGLKGHEDLIDALAICRDWGLPVKGVFVGGAWAGANEYEKSVRAYGQRRLGNHAVFLGTRSDVGELYSDFGVAVHPSHSENIGGAGESLALGIPTIATNVGGFPDIVIPDETGWLVPPRDPKALAVSIRSVLMNPGHAETLAKRGRRLVLQELDVKRTASQILEIYDHVLE